MVFGFLVSMKQSMEIMLSEEVAIGVGDWKKLRTKGGQLKLKVAQRTMSCKWFMKILK